MFKQTTAYEIWYGLVGSEMCIRDSHHISGEDHHKHGQYLIRHTRMCGFTAPEVDQLYLIVRYHRGKPLKRKDLARLTEEDGRKVSILAAILAVADGLDRGHDRNTCDVDATLDSDVLTIAATTRGPAHLERWAVVQRSESLQRALGATVKVDVRSTLNGPVEQEPSQMHSPDRSV